MEKAIAIPTDMMKRARNLPGTAELTDSQIISMCLEAGLASEVRSTVEAINRELDRASLRQLSLILRCARNIIGKEGE